MRITFLCCITKRIKESIIATKLQRKVIYADACLQLFTYMKLKIKVDKDLCIGSGTCVIMDPDNFELNTEGKSTVKKSFKEKPKGFEMEIEVDEKGMERFLNAAKSCPTQAISVTDENGKLLFP